MPASIEVSVFDEFMKDAFAAKGKDELNAVLIKAMRKLGFDRINVSTMRDVELPKSQQKFALTCDYPAEWLRRYQRKNYVQIDPVALSARSGVDPFFWDDLIKMGNLTKSQLAVLGEAQEARLFHGVGLPFRGAPGLRGGVALAVSQPDIEHSTNLGLLWAMANFYYLMFKHVTIAEHTMSLALSPRESEVASLVFLGMKNLEISQALGSSRHTVNNQVRQIFSKFGVHSRAEAIFRAISGGIYDPR